MKQLNLIAVFLLFTIAAAFSQSSLAYLVLDNENYKSGDVVEVRVLKNICAMQIRHADWKVDVRPVSFDVVVSSNGSIFKAECRAGSGGEALDKVLAKLKTGDIVFVDHIEVSQSVKKQVGQFAFTVK